jgi:hypothetical protein
MIIEDMANAHPMLRIQRAQVLKLLSQENHSLYQHISHHLDKLCQFYNFDVKATIDKYLTFTERYLDNFKTFQKTGLYPAKISSDVMGFSRATYDVFLVVSALITPHRFNIMSKFYDDSKLLNSGMRILVIGVGSGLELCVLNLKEVMIDSYDIEESRFVSKSFPGVAFHYEEFLGNEKEIYDAVIAIEVLEHLAEPCSLIRAIRRAIKSDGICLLTTATDVPQFDHLYNFTDSEKFTGQIENIGFTVEESFEIPHKYLLAKASAKNTYYRLRVC